MKKEKLVILICVIILVVAAVIVAIVMTNKNKDEDRTNEPQEVEENTQAEVINDAEFEGLNINDVRLTVEGDYSNFTAMVVNNTEEVKNLEKFGVILKDKDGNEVITLGIYLGEALNPGEAREISASVDMPLTNDIVASAEYTEYDF